MNESIRQGENKHAKTGYLYWNQRNNNKKVGIFTYIWKIIFTFEDAYKETVTLKSGIQRKNKEN